MVTNVPLLVGDVDSGGDCAFVRVTGYTGTPHTFHLNKSYVLSIIVILACLRFTCVFTF